MWLAHFSLGRYIWYQSQVSILGLVGYGPTTLLLRHYDKPYGIDQPPKSSYSPIKMMQVLFIDLIYFHKLLRLYSFPKRAKHPLI